MFTTIDEPGVLANLCNMPQFFTKDAIKAVFRALSKPMSNMPKHFLIKPASHSINLVPLLHKYTPEVKQLYLYRDGRSTVDSFVRAFILNNQMKTIKSVEVFKEMSVSLPFLQNALCQLPNMDIIQSAEAFLTWMWASNVKLYLEYVNDRVPIHAVKYEIFKQNPEAVVYEMLQKLGYPTSLTKDGLKALEKDSQRGMDFSQDKAQAKGSVPLPTYDDPDVKCQCDAICDYLKVPRLDQPVGILPGTITGGGGTE